MAPRKHFITANRWAQIARAVAYLSMAVAGAFIIGLPDVFGIYYRWMGLCCVVGGLCSFFGASTGRWGGEYMGLPLIGAAMGTFALLTFRDSWDAARWVVVPSVLFLVSFGILFTARWIDVATVGRAAKEYANARRR